MATKYEYEETAVTSSVNCGGETYWCQTFTVGTVGSNENFDITSIFLKIYKLDSPSGNFNVNLYATSGGEPTGSSLSNGYITASSLGTSSNTTVEITMSSYELQASTQYALVFSAPDADSENNTVIIEFDDNNYAGGTFFYSGDSGSSWFDIGVDIWFQVWGDSATTGTNQWINVDDSWRQLSEIWVNKDDTWREVSEAWINKDDVWRKLF